MSALLAKYPKIDGIISDYGTDALAARARSRPPAASSFRSGRSTPTVSRASTRRYKGNPRSARDDLVSQLARPGGRPKAIAAAEGLPNKEPSIYELPFFEDSSAVRPLVCDPSAAPDFYSRTS